MAEKNSEHSDILHEAKKAFQQSADAENDNRQSALEDIRFSRLSEQWPEAIRKQREIEGRPCLTINKLPAFIRQVVNDARQAKPAIKVHPADSKADPKTAEIINGLIRNIEYASNADVAYDTGMECAVTGGFGYWRVGLDYAFDDSFEMDITIDRIANPFSVYGDPYSTAADSSDWDTAFVVDRVAKSVYEATYKDTAPVDWDDDAWSGLADTAWIDDEVVMVAEWWRREKVQREILLFADKRDGSLHTYSAEDFEKDPDLVALRELGMLEFRQKRMAPTHKVTQYKLSGAEVLEEPYDWPGRYIPIVPVYGDEFDIEGKRYFRSLVHNSLDAQRMFNYWRTASTELVALAPKVPFIGPKGAFTHDIDRWNTANVKSHPFLEYVGNTPPQRQPLDMGTAAGALQEALNASDDIKSIIGLYDASLGARSNETSGKAILARQREGDVSTFHFVDNMARAIRHTGRILIDLIPKVYDTPRIVRVIGEDDSQRNVAINQEAPEVDDKGQPVVDEMGEAVMAMHDITAGKYDLTVSTGPSYTTQREEAAAAMTEMIRAFPASAPAIGPELAKSLDWPGAQKIAEKLEAMTQGPQIPPEIQERLQQLEQENAQLKADRSIEQGELGVKQYDAETKRMKAEGDLSVDRAQVGMKALGDLTKGIDGVGPQSVRATE
ncbi:portal protein [Nitratireductor sp. CH_MIT9313-5]|uniref:portal protein n=1 Tax=Nitratireductor sp. CH_MIT9313-5 TaxID=3107764 RepID=UPI0030091761